MKVKLEKSKIIRELKSWSKVIITAVVITFIVNNLIVVNAYVPSSSMEKTIMKGDRLFANRLSYIFDEPKRGDIVVFKFPDDKSILYVKRIIGMPGDEVVIEDNHVFINGEIIQEEYLRDEMIGDYGPYLVPEASYFMLGDNRNSSADSRKWINTYLQKEDILGKVFIRIFPNLRIFN